MKKTLTATTALVALAFASSAYAAEKMRVGDIDLRIGGQVNAYGGMINAEADRDSDFDIMGEGKLNIGASGEGAGLTFGAELEMYANADSDLNVDKAWLWVGTPLAQFHFGDNKGASSLLRVGAPNLGAGTLNSSDGERAAHWMRFLGVGPLLADGVDTGNSTKVSAVSESFNGFRVGASYTPTLDRGANITFDRDTKNFFEVAARYDGKFDQFGYGFGAGYLNGTAIEEDLTRWNVGGHVNWNQLTIGGSYDRLEFDGIKVEEYGAGATFQVNEALALGVNYAHNVSEGDKANVYSFGALYHVTRNLAVHSDIGFVDRSGADKVDSVATIGMRVNF